MSWDLQKSTSAALVRRPSRSNPRADKTCPGVVYGSVMRPQALEKKDDSEKRDVHAYRSSLAELLARYSDDNGSTAFDEVADLNKYKGCRGVYVLSLDGEMQYYVGQASTSIRDRTVEHFRRPSSAFDRTHSFTDISAIHVLPVYDEWFRLVDKVEADCIATLGPDRVCNAFAASPAWFEAMVRQLDIYEKLDPEFSADALLNELLFPVMYDGVRSDSYEPAFFQMSDDEVRRVVKAAPHVAQAAIEKQAKMAARTTKGRRPIARLDDNMRTLEIYQSVAEASRSVGVSTKSLRDAARGVQKHAGGLCLEVCRRVAEVK